jgi:uncharacterized protein (TIGR03067 family)
MTPALLGDDPAKNAPANARPSVVGTWRVVRIERSGKEVPLARRAGTWTFDLTHLTAAGGGDRLRMPYTLARAHRPWRLTVPRAFVAICRLDGDMLFIRTAAFDYPTTFHTAKGPDRNAALYVMRRFRQ